MKALELASYDPEARNGRSIFTEMPAPDLFEALIDTLESIDITDVTVDKEFFKLTFKVRTEKQKTVTVANDSDDVAADAEATPTQSETVTVVKEAIIEAELLADEERDDVVCLEFRRIAGAHKFAAK